MCVIQCYGFLRSFNRTSRTGTFISFHFICQSVFVDFFFLCFFFVRISSVLQRQFFPSNYAFYLHYCHPLRPMSRCIFALKIYLLLQIWPIITTQINLFEVGASFRHSILFASIIIISIVDAHTCTNGTAPTDEFSSEQYLTYISNDKLTHNLKR